MILLQTAAHIEQAHRHCEGGNALLPSKPCGTVMTVDGVAIDIPEINMSHVCIHLLYHSILYTVFSMHAFMKAPTLYIDFWV